MLRSLTLTDVGLALETLLQTLLRSGFVVLLLLLIFFAFVRSGRWLWATMRSKRSSTATRSLRGIASACMTGVSFLVTMLAGYALSLAIILQVVSTKMAPRSEKKFEKISSGLSASKATSKRRMKRHQRSKSTSG